MGANDKAEATYHGREYTPSLRLMRAHWTFCGGDSKLFDRRIEQVRAEAKAEALEEAVGAYPTMLRDMVSRPSVARWLRDRANQYKEEQ